MPDVVRIYAVDFGAGRTGLATVGYRLTGSARTTLGVTEPIAGSGIYQASITHPDVFAGTIVWDTGAAPLSYAVESVYPGIQGPQGEPGLSPSASPTSLLDSLYCTDEDIAFRLTKDYVDVVPKHQSLAGATDGVFSAGSPWVIASATQSFSTLGVAAGNVIYLSQPAASFPPGGDLLAVHSVSGNSATLRRIGRPAGLGRPPAPSGGLSGVKFDVWTFQPQIDVATYELNKEFNIDPLVAGRTPDDLYDARELRDAAALKAIIWQYTQSLNERTSAYKDKIEVATALQSVLHERMIVKWAAGSPAETTRRHQVRVEV